MQKRFLFNWKVISSAVVVMLLVAAFASFAGGSVAAQDTPSRVITVSGTGDAFGAPDIAYVNLGTDVSDPDIGKALDSANQTMAAIVAALTDAGVDAKDIQTVNFNVYQNKFDPQTGQPLAQPVYQVQTAVNVTVRDITKVAAIMQAGLNAGANTVNGLNFGISEMGDLEQQARLTAVDDARNRAQQLADAFGVTLGDVISVSETFGNLPVQPLFARDASLALGGAAPQINPGQLSVNVQVTVTFAIGS